MSHLEHQHLVRKYVDISAIEVGEDDDEEEDDTGSIDGMYRRPTLTSC